MAVSNVTATTGTKRKAAATGKGTGGYEIPWVEKYRPRILDDVVGNEDTLVRLRAIAEDGDMPNLILCGPPGTGKVSDYFEKVRGVCVSSSEAIDSFLSARASVFFSSIPNAPLGVNLCFSALDDKCPCSCKTTSWIR